MFRSHSVKIIISFLGLSVLTIGFLVFWLSYELPQTKWALALPGSIDQGWVPLRGWAWVGAPNACTGVACGDNPSPSWISFNCRHGDHTDAQCKDGTYKDYWVAVNETTGELDGYAWSDNVGWISFRKTGFCMNGNNIETESVNDLGGTYTTPKNCDENLDSNNNCPIGHVCCSGVYTCQFLDPPSSSGCPNGSLACYDKTETERKFHGWARILSEADTAAIYDNGWIKLDNLVINGTDFGLKVIDEDQATGDPKGGAPWGDLLGWAWNGANANLGGNSTSGLGWLSFNCNNPNAGGCASPYQYQVSGRPNALGNLQVTRIDGDDSHGLSVDWTNGYPAYGATYYEVWRQNGRCSNIAEDCDSDLYCTGGTCNLLAYDKKQTQTGGPPWPDQPLNLFVTYKYVVRACNIFACSKTSEQSFKTSPINNVPRFKAVPICSAPDAAPPASYVDLSWNEPYIAFKDDNGFSIDHYQIQYRQANPGETAADCTNGSDWQSTVANCDGDQTGTSCREVLTESTGRYHGQNFYVYRLRAWGNKGICVGGDNNLNDCTTDAQCPGGDPPAYCEIHKSSWACSNVFRICPVGTSYEERRPQ